MEFVNQYSKLSQLLYVPYFTRVRNSAVDTVCIKSQEYKIAKAELASKFHNSFDMCKNKSDIF